MERTIEIPTCDNCESYRHFPDMPPGRRVCAFNPPTPHVFLMPPRLAGQPPVQVVVTAFPEPNPRWACGRHSAKENEQKAPATPVSFQLGEPR